MVDKRKEKVKLPINWLCQRHGSGDPTWRFQLTFGLHRTPPPHPDRPIAVHTSKDYCRRGSSRGSFERRQRRTFQGSKDAICIDF